MYAILTKCRSIPGLNASLASVIIGLALVFSILLIGCGDENTVKPKDIDDPPIMAQKVELYRSPRGTGQYDKMTYYHYESLSQFRSDSTLAVIEIVPDVWYCNGTGYFMVSIYDENGELLGHAKSESETTNLSVTFGRPIILEATKPYRFYFHAWTTKSVGIYTTGNDPSLCKDWTCLKPFAAFGSNDFMAVDHTDRGAIGFRLIGFMTE